ncbi:unnamed protein product [Penicillium roqueforti FM164]|uniref:Str. FM013 n=2 Tax=Penicillium TaxID=5073 RepID=A0A0G4PZ44_PENC3|nr:unnamed protein product [Penicillium roqueforti FM164]CRL31420.1 unnamed protein product [Penicillium camemberti]
MQLATQLLQSRYEDTIAWEEIESDTASGEYFLTETARREVPKRAVADEEELYEITGTLEMNEYV